MPTKTPNAFAAIACSSLMLIGVAAAQQTVPPVQVEAPGDTGRRIGEDGLLANYYAARRRPMARQIHDRLREHRRPDATLLAYENAGHRAFGLPLSLDNPRLASALATFPDLNGVLADSWTKTVAFLNANLRN